MITKIYATDYVCVCVCVWILHSKQTDSYGMPALYFKDPGLEFKPVTTRGEGGGILKFFLSKHFLLKIYI